MTLVKSVLSEIEVSQLPLSLNTKNQEIYSKPLDFMYVHSLELSQCVYMFN